MGDLEELLDHWRAQDALFERVEAGWWGAVTSDARYPALQEPNYARVDTHHPVGLAEVESALLPAMRRSGAARPHVLIFHHEDQLALLAEASTRGERITWDLAMATGDRRTGGREGAEEITTFDDAFWSAHRDSARLFEVAEDAALDQLQAMEREVMIPAGRRWFGVRERGRPVALGALLVLEGVGYLDHVVTFPRARRRGHARALTRRAMAEAEAMGARRTYLLAEPEGVATRLYADLGFEQVGRLASWLSPFER